MADKRMTQTQLIKKLAEAAGVNNKVAKTLLETFAATAVAETKKNGVFVLPGIGRLVRVDRVESLRDVAHHQVELRFAGEVPLGAFAGLPGVSDVTTEDHTLRMRVSGSITPVVRAAASFELLDFVSREPSLEETFLAEYARTPEAVA